MRIIKKIALMGTAFILIVVMVFLMVNIRLDRAFVTVRNSSNAEITDAEILMNAQKIGKGIFIGRVARGKEVTIRVDFKSGHEGLAKLIYKDSLNQEHLSDEMYIATGLGAHVFFIVTESRIVTEDVGDLIFPLF